MTRHIVASRKADWASPFWLFNALDTEFNFTVDLAAAEYNAKLPRYFDVAYDTLSKGPLRAPERGWCNPPYDDIERWLQWGLWSCQYGGFSVWLVPANTDTQWFHKYAALGQVDFFSGRIAFEDVTPPDIELPRLLGVTRKLPAMKNYRKLAACAYKLVVESAEREYLGFEPFVETARLLEKEIGPGWFHEGKAEAEKKLSGPGFPSMLVIFDPEAPAGWKPFRSRDCKTGKLVQGAVA